MSMTHHSLRYYLSEWLTAVRRHLATAGDATTPEVVALKSRRAWYQQQHAKVEALFGKAPHAIWLVKANIVEQRPFGPGGLERRNGSRLFQGGAKVYVVRLWRNASPGRVTVVGRHRRSHRFVSCILPTAWLSQLRLELVRSPTVIQHFWLFPEQSHDYGSSESAGRSVIEWLSPCSATPPTTALGQDQPRLD